MGASKPSRFAGNGSIVNHVSNSHAGFLKVLIAAGTFVGRAGTLEGVSVK